MPDEKVSIIIPNYNKASFLDECIRSCLGQSYPNIEIIVVDDCSTDQSRSVLQKYVDRGQIKPVFLNENGGVSNARNAGAKIASGYWLTFLDSDDVLINHRKIENEVAILKSPRDIAFSQWVPMSESGAILPHFFTKRNIYSSKAAISKILSITEPGYRQLRGYLFSKQLFEEVGGYNSPFNLYEDFYLQCKLVLNGKLKYTNKYGEAYRNVSGPRLSAQAAEKANAALAFARTKIYREMNYFQRFYYHWRMSRFFRLFRRVAVRIFKFAKEPKQLRPLFIADYGLAAPNSCATILDRLITDRDNSAVVLLDDSQKYCYLDVVQGVKHFRFLGRATPNEKPLFSRSILDSLFVFAARVFNRLKAIKIADDIYARLRASAIRHVLRKSGCNYVVSFRYNPDLDLLKLGKPFSVLLYDTVLKRPDATLDRLLRIEQKVIKKADNYFVPSCFFPPYRSHYRDVACLQQYEFPLFPTEDEVRKLTKLRGNRFRFAYFGQLQSFRRPSTVFSFLNQAGIEVDVFSPDVPPEFPNVRYHGALPQNEALTHIAATEFAIAMDNDEPYTEYLPSKSFQLLALCKPVIIFGRNQKSALRLFFADYPRSVYIDPDQPDSLSQFNEFTARYSRNEFNVHIYQKYRDQYDSISIKKRIRYILFMSFVHGGRHVR